MAVFPHSGFKITCTSSDKGGRFTQFFTLEITPASWEKELSHARTFCFYEEIEFLIKNGLIKGGSLENAIVIREDAVLTGVESRTSSPVRITRDETTLQSLNTRGLFPGGEGAGYAGGILSAGVDGIKLAEAVVRSLQGAGSV